MACSRPLLFWLYNTVVFIHCIGSETTLVYNEIIEPLGFLQDKKKIESSDTDLDIFKFTIWHCSCQ